MVYVIAEIGKNTDGDLGRCAELVRAVHRAGAQAVRFAHFSLDASVHPDALRPGAERAWSLALELPFRTERLFDADGYRAVLDLCGELGLDLIGTPWDLPSLEVFQAAGVTDYAVNSINAYNLPAAQRILAAARRSYLSTGGLGEPQVKRLVEALELSGRDAVLMHAVTAYPAPLSTLNLRALQVLQRYHPHVGYSSNDLVPTAPLAAVANGATVIGKHVHLLDGAGPAHRASITVGELAELVATLREFEAASGEERKHESRGEMANRDVLAKGLVLARAVPSGQPLTAEDLALQLPPKGVLAEEWFDVLGLPAARDLTAGDYLFTADVGGQRDDDLGERGVVPGERGVVVRLKDIDEMTAGRDFDYVEVHYAASDIGKPDTFDEYDLDVVVHVPEYADGVLLDLCAYDEALRRFSIEVIDRVMAKARALRPRFTRGGDLVRFVIHPGALTHPDPLADPSRQYELFADAMRRMNTDGLEVLVENMTPFAWFLAGDWSPRQGVSNSFLDPHAMRAFVEEHGYRMTLDLCHAQLYCNHAGLSLREYMEVVRPVVGHIHFSDATGIDGEGIRVGTGDIDWRAVCEVFGGHTGGWTPEIWNGHHDHGARFCQAHRDLNAQFRLYGPAPCER
ncbi:N-acetylneuraminate synthase family protein [Dactylosporangium aurantiacum]|uniref:N-acetylneuraminate synthase family protein n=1 Tax=Dactylosporangium aurantiacum TaxID=35754 RepID=A0A9Q9MLN1_9ACTN|nr:N-acetylneuraminate synthase family protein [Dactylosporangium aurantiacum]MDG6108625.1 N-acetylneuraminate synthase family protein [Dactylosporangium aurantiacum]UWZ59155.1 N-acetylneuraminate synthase family protein [Dactylosporangium aurantiacum]